MRRSVDWHAINKRASHAQKKNLACFMIFINLMYYLKIKAMQMYADKAT